MADVSRETQTCSRQPKTSGTKYRNEMGEAAGVEPGGRGAETLDFCLCRLLQTSESLSEIYQCRITQQDPTCHFTVWI